MKVPRLVKCLIRYFITSLLLIAAPFIVNSAPPVGYLEKVADAIYWAEGGEKTKHPYGLIYYHIKSKAESRRVCMIHLRRYYDDWELLGGKGDFLVYLARYWAPVEGVHSSHIFYNKNWLKNVRYFVEHPKPVI